MTDEDEEASYCECVGEAFLTLRGAPLTLSPLDFDLLCRWYARGIPAATVLATLETVFAQRRRRNEPRSVPLRYFTPAVEEAWESLVENLAPGLRDGQTIQDLLRGY